MKPPMGQRTSRHSLRRYQSGTGLSDTLHYDSRDFNRPKHTPAYRSFMLSGQPITRSGTQAKGSTSPSTCPRCRLTHHLQEFHWTLLRAWVSPEGFNARASPSPRSSMRRIVRFPNGGPSFVPSPIFDSDRYNQAQTSMISGRRIGCEVAVLAVLSVLAIFLFPGVQGPYPVVHGPVSALQAARAAVRLRTAMVQSALTSPANAAVSAVVVLSSMSLSNLRFESISLPDYGSILRC
jgi:hypothetical protein